MKSCNHALCEAINPQDDSKFYARKTKSGAPGLSTYCRKCFVKWYSTPRNKTNSAKRQAARLARKTAVADLPNERWADVDGYDHCHYMISSLGRIKRITEYGERLRAPHLNKHLGYWQINLTYAHDKYRTEYVHRLMAFAFISNPLSYNEVNHVNGVRSDNTLSNLEFCTHRQNVSHAIHVLGRHGVVSNVKNARAKLLLPTQVCSRCQQTLDKTMFYKDENNLSGLECICKECRRKISKEYKRIKRETANQK